MTRMFRKTKGKKPQKNIQKTLNGSWNKGHLMAKLAKISFQWTHKKSLLFGDSSSFGGEKGDKKRNILEKWNNFIKPFGLQFEFRWLVLPHSQKVRFQLSSHLYLQRIWTNQEMTAVHPCRCTSSWTEPQIAHIAWGKKGGNKLKFRVSTKCPLNVSWKDLKKGEKMIKIASKNTPDEVLKKPKNKPKNPQQND